MSHWISPFGTVPKPGLCNKCVTSWAIVKYVMPDRCLVFRRITIFPASAFPWTLDFTTSPTVNIWGSSSGNSSTVRSILCMSSGVIAFCIGPVSRILMDEIFRPVAVMCGPFLQVRSCFREARLPRLDPLYWDKMRCARQPKAGTVYCGPGKRCA
jgi:hypothetical protein